ncbi:MAG: LuxR C-terminal-related transcriptional regulator [Chloroflexota bacterium]|nr:LuxR C-terminal-related transcriptional regulator [Chloroflexota bacterium]
MLTTKLFVPQQRPQFILRQRLLTQLNDGLAQGKRLTLVSAPPGFGKTTLIAAWAAALERPQAWVSLDEDDNDPIQFLRYGVAALRQIDPNAARNVEALLGSPQALALPHLAAALINDIALLPPLLLVLDDYHLIHDTGVQQIVRLLIERQPPALHLVICTREDPPLPLAQLRAHAEITELRQRELRFDPDEIRLFMNNMLGEELPVDALRALGGRTEGWITGLQLAALAMQEMPERVESFIHVFSGSDRYVMDYLISEVLQRQSPQVRAFLSQTAVLERLNADVCNAVTGRNDSDLLLRQMDKENVFLIPLDNQRNWYRYHHLFADMLRAMLSAPEQVTLHGRACAWHAEQGSRIQAIHHAKAIFTLSGDSRAFANLVRVAAEETLQRGALQMLGGWLDALPADVLRGDPALALYRAWVAALTGDLPLATVWMDSASASQSLSEGFASNTARSSLVLRAFLAMIYQRDYPLAIESAVRALDILDDTQPSWRWFAVWSLAEAHKRSGNLTAALATIEAANPDTLLGNADFFNLIILTAHISALYLNGQLAAAIALCKTAVARFTNERGEVAALTGMALNWLGRLHCETNELHTAQAALDSGMSMSEQIGLEPYRMFAHAYRALLCDAMGERASGLTHLHTAQQLAAQTGFVDARWFAAWEILLRLRAGAIDAARAWAEEGKFSVEDTPNYLNLESQMVYARLLVLERTIPEARAWLAKLEAFTRSSGMMRALITIHLLQVQAADTRSSAVQYVTQAIALAAPEGFIRAFLEEGESILSLLPVVRHVAPRFVDEVLNHAGRARDQEHAHGADGERLSERELEVLRLIADGLSNAEIAGRLFIAVGTVKRHVNHIYDKMDVDSRTQAVAKARTMALLD